MPPADPTTGPAEDRRFMAAAIALSERGRGLSTPNPNVGCLIVRDGRVVGRGWTQKGGRPHAEAQALEQAMDRAHGATAYVTLEPCFHLSPRGPRCADLLARAGIRRAVIALRDPDPRTNGQGAAWLRDHGVAVEMGLMEAEARAAMAGFVLRQTLGRPAVTLKLGLSLDGRIALPDGSSRWITGPDAGYRGAGTGRPPSGGRRRADGGGFPAGRAGRPAAALPRADPDRRRIARHRRHRPCRPVPGAWALGAG
jgi:diaminohydroxyphosphoribosylaminopyrimidine deaminase/5-amino-6-(5-phosphoribosylamino)uracil reductase